MTDSTDKIVQYLVEARSSEIGLVRELQAQIGMTPRSTYRTLLEKHLRETRSHADRLATRLDELGHSRNPVEMVGAVALQVVGQMVALSRTPLALVRGSGGEEKVLKNAKDSCAAESLEIATYIALERLANDLGDERTAQVAATIRAEEEQMLERIQRELLKLTDAVVKADVHGEGSYDISKIGVVDAARETAGTVKQTARDAGGAAKRASRQARKVPGVAQAEGEVKGAFASAEDLAISGYDDLTAEEIVGKLPLLSQIDLAKIDAYERREQSRSTVVAKIDTLRGDEPWPGYDELTVAEITAALRDADADTVEGVRKYERTHKDRTSVMKATERKLAAVS